jgi:hypothetical protein
MDTKDIAPGEDWRTAIMNAIRDASTFLICLTTNSVNRQGFIQEEISEALDVLAQREDADVYFLPVRIEPCEIPERLAKYQWVDLFEPQGAEQLARVVAAGIVRAKLRAQSEVAPETLDMLDDLFDMAAEREWLHGPFQAKTDPFLDPVDREHIHKFAHLTCGSHPELLARLDAEVPPGSHRLFVLDPSKGGETELAEVYRTVVMRDEVDAEAFVEISKAVHAFLQRMWGQQVQVNVFECVFALIKYAISKVRHWNCQIKESTIELIRYVAKNSSAQVENAGGAIRVSWEGDLGAIEFVFPDTNPWQ